MAFNIPVARWDHELFDFNRKSTPCTPPLDPEKALLKPPTVAWQNCCCGMLWIVHVVSKLSCNFGRVSVWLLNDLD